MTKKKAEIVQVDVDEEDLHEDLDNWTVVTHNNVRYYRRSQSEIGNVIDTHRGVPKSQHPAVVDKQKPAKVYKNRKGQMVAKNQPKSSISKKSEGISVGEEFNDIYKVSQPPKAFPLYHKLDGEFPDYHYNKKEKRSGKEQLNKQLNWEKEPANNF